MWFNKQFQNTVHMSEYIKFSELSLHLQKNAVDPFNIEGHSQQIHAQTRDLIEMVRDAKNVLEIGFNAGHSSEIFLENSSANVFSFDIGDHNYVLLGKRNLDSRFPGRHTLILGDSGITVPTFAKYSNIKFDLLFIDGNHEYDAALGDLMNCAKVAAPNACVLFDDVVLNEENSRSWTEGPTKSWNYMVSNNKIRHAYHREYSEGRGMVFGQYI
jgi:predicted O-methyltransferase YrrM